MSTQLIGFSVAGICKRILVAPPSMIWPANLVTAALFNTLHSQETSGTHSQVGISRGRFFTYVFVGYLLYSQCFYLGKYCLSTRLVVVTDFLPSYIFTALSSFSWVCWMAPNNRVVNQLFGVTHGMAMGVLTFDWGQISYNISPLSVPWWAAVNLGFTIVFFYWILTPILYVWYSCFFLFPFLTISCQYTNVWYSAYLPLVSSQSFDNTGKTYNVSRIINDDSSFNLEAYKAYSPLFLSASFVVSYGLSFASITATLTHTFLFYRKQVWIQARRSLSEQPDTHARLMSVYKEVPDWWYLTIFGSLCQY